MFIKKLLFLFLLLPSTFLIAGDSVLDQYVASGLKNNLALQQKNFDVQKSLSALKEAKGMFMPSVSINARYSRAGGGRQIYFPVGDIVNPIYQTLNQLLQQQRFPENIPNVDIPFLREREQETKVRVVQPLFQPAIYYNYKIKSQLRNVQEAGRNAFARQLIAEIKTAYFNYLKTVKIVKLMDQTRKLLDENLRVSESLFKNDKATKEVVYRARAEISGLEQQRAESEKNRKMARSYFNFLLNKDLDSSVGIMEIDSVPPVSVPDLQGAQESALQNREELEQLQYAISAAYQNAALSKSNFLPTITAVVDYGIEGEEYRFNKDADFWMASGVLQWNLFNGFQDKAKLQQARLERKKTEVQLAELKKQIRLQVQEAFENLNVGRKAIRSAQDQLQSAKKSFQIVNRKYRENMTPQIEYLDARNTLTQAEINYVVTVYDYRIKLAEMEKVTAGYEMEINLKYKNAGEEDE